MIKLNGPEKVNAIGYKSRPPIHDEYGYEQDAYYVNEQLELFC